MTCRDEVLSAAHALTHSSPNGEFTVDDVLNFLKRKGTQFKESTIRTHVISRMCANAPDNHETTFADLRRVGYGRYRLNQKASDTGASVDQTEGNRPNRPASASVKKNHDLDALSEDEIKSVLNDWLMADGWQTEVAWGHRPGIDIKARKNDLRWVIEVKGPGSRPPMRVNYFLAILGETLQRMNDDQAQYSIALPDLPQYHGLWERLPRLAKERTGISMLFVNENKHIKHLKEVDAIN